MCLSLDAANRQQQQQAPVARRALWALFLALILILAFVNHLFTLVSGGVALKGNNQTAEIPNGSGGGQQVVVVALKGPNSSLLYECELSYVQMDISLIKFTINYLELLPPEEGQLTGEENDSKQRDVQNDNDDGKNITTQEHSGKFQRKNKFWLPEIVYDGTATPAQLTRTTKLNATQPFIFFINGFNTFRPNEDIRDSWMWDVAKSFAEPAEKATTLPMRNVIFLTWSIPNLFANNLLSMIPAYYKTVANYDLIMESVRATLAKLIAFVDSTRRFESSQARLDYFGQWHFYGHSLGSHILSDAVSRVVLTSGSNFNLQVEGPHRQPPPPLKFGKLVGLDPATPCFVSREYGISSAKVAEAVREVLVLHSNAGFAGVPNERANLEIVLNGGTFQPGCAWYDFTCHHVRSTDILSYLDDTCQMVAYKCTSYHHFKLGACETCYSLTTGSSSAKLTPDTYERLVRNCVLVNLPEQHRDSREILDYAEQFNDDQLRQLSAEATNGRGGGGLQVRRSPPSGSRLGPHPIELFRRLEELERRQAEAEAEKLELKVQTGSGSDLKSINWEKSYNSNSSGEATAQKHTESPLPAATCARARKSYYHFVSTSPNFRFGRKTHCLQHYQLRLLIYYNQNGTTNATKTIPNLKDKCKLSSFYLVASDEIKLKLYYELGQLARQNESRKNPSQRQVNEKLVLDSGHGDGYLWRQMSSSIKLNAIIKDLFHTTLVNFEGPPKLFTGAQLVNLDLDGLSECLLRETRHLNSEQATLSDKTANLTDPRKGLALVGGPNFVLDIAFMSHTNQKIRHAFSSVLCGQLDLESYERRQRRRQHQQFKNASNHSGPTKTSESDYNDLDYENDDDDNNELTLKLCKKSDLTDVSSQIDKLLAHMRLHRLDETWKVSLLNSLFSLFTEWEPF